LRASVDQTDAVNATTWQPVHVGTALSLEQDSIVLPVCGIDWFGP
jgi:hypothetical protein